MMGDRSSSRRKKKSRAQEEESDDDMWDSEDDDDTIARIQRAHFAQTAAMNNRRKTSARPQRMSHKRKMEAVKNFHDFTKKLKKDTGISIRSLVGNNILELDEFSSEDSNSDSDGLSEEGEFVVNPNAVQELNEENESYIDPETGDIVEGKKSERKKSLTKSPEPPKPESNAPQPKTLSISDIINEDLDLSKNVEIAEVEESELCPDKDLLSIKEEDSSSQDFDMKKLSEMDGLSVKPVKQEDEEKTNDEQKMDTDEEKKPTNPNALNVRRNIREVMDEKNLDASTLAAQRQESERLARVQEQQRIIREVQRQIAINRQNKIHQKTLSLLQGGSSLLKKSATQKLNLPNTVLVKLPSGEVKRTTMKPGQVEVSKIIKPGPSGQKIKKEVVEIVDSSSGEESSSSSSDSDDCIMLSDSEVPPSPEAEEDPANSGLHVNDTYNTPDEQGRVLINIGHPESEEDIFLAPQIARIIKPHQIGGVRFLFDNIIESVERFSTSTGFGCILAHSMGLGKTLQIVCFCDIFLRHTNSKTVLCIMPINTLQNWVAEFNMWLPLDPTNSPLAVHGEVRPRSFPIYVLNDSHKTLQMRAKVVKDWKSTGGVLMIGYELYRLLSMKKDKKPRKKKEKKGDAKAEAEKDKDEKKIDTGNEDTQDSKKADDIKPEKEDGDGWAKLDPDAKDKDEKKDDPSDEDKKLLDEMYEALVRPGPDLVICDEGHRIKNSHSNISYALKQMRTKRRIVLTGYPLQNNLLEYWCMVDFVRPNYLGSKTEFCNMFERPIQNGQCIDSTPQDIRLMRYRAHVLHSLLVGFVQRRSHAVLQSTLPQKEEYVLLVRMTPLQRKLYDRFMNEVVRSTSVPNPLKAFAICCKIWNHPDVLYNFLKKRSEANAALEEDLDLEEIGGVTKAGRVKNKPGRKPGKPRGSTKKPAATIQPNIAGPKQNQPDSRNFGSAPYTPNGPFNSQGLQSSSYGPNQSDRSYPPYPYQGSGQGYYPPNQGFNQQYDNSYYSQQQQQQQYGDNNYPNQFPPNNSDSNQGYNHNYWGGGNYYSNPEFYGNSQQFGNNQPPSDFQGNSQQFRSNEGTPDIKPNTQQFPSNQQPASFRDNSQEFPGASQQFSNNEGSSDLRTQQFPNTQSTSGVRSKPQFPGQSHPDFSRETTQQFPNNQPPDYRANLQQYPSNQASTDFTGNSQPFARTQGTPDMGNTQQPYANNQIPSDLRTNTPSQYPNNQQSPDLRGTQPFASNQETHGFRGNQSQFPSNQTPSDLRSLPQQYPGAQTSPDVRGTPQQYGNNDTAPMDLKPTSQYPSNQQMPEMRGNQSIYSSSPQSTPELRSNLPQYQNNQAQDFTTNSQQYGGNSATSDMRNNSQQFINNRPTSDTTINQQHFPNNQAGDFRGNSQQYPNTPTPTAFGGSTQQYANNQTRSEFSSNNIQPFSTTSSQSSSEFGNNPQYPNNQTPSDLERGSNPNEPYNSQTYQSNFSSSRTDQPFASNALQPYNQSNQDNFSNNERPPYQGSFPHNPQSYGGYNQNPPSVSPYSSNQSSQNYSNQNFPNYSGNSNTFGNQFENQPQNYSDYSNRPQNSNIPDSIKSDVPVEPSYQALEKKCGPSVTPNPRDVSYGNSPYNYSQPNTSAYPERAGAGLCPYPNYDPPIETKPPLGSANSGSAMSPWPMGETLKTELGKLKAEDKLGMKSESDGEVKIEDLDTKKLVKDETNKTNVHNSLAPVKAPAVQPGKKTQRKPSTKGVKTDESDTEKELPKKNKRGRPKGSKNGDGKLKQKASAKAKGRKDRKTSKEKNDDNNEDDSEESEKEEKLNKEEELALVKKAEEMTYDWATDLLKDYIPGIIENSAKMELFFYILNESIKLGDRILLFSQSLFTLNLIEDFLEKNYIPGTHSLWQRNTSYFRLDGSTHALEREKLINEFNANPNIYLFLVSTRAGSLGINLVGANRVIVFDASWNPCHDTQAVCRVYRYGQRKPCFVYRFVMDWCLEKKIYDRQINKQGMADRVVDECNPDAVLSMKEITNLCFDNDEKESEPKDLSEYKDKYIDVLMQGIITLHGKLLSKEPFQHESLLVDRKEKKLSSAEKRLAQRGYELEKKAALAPKPTGAYRTVRAADGSLVQRPVASVRPMQHGGHARWIPADVWRRQGMTAQEMTLPLDVVIPTNSAEKTNIVLKAGQRVMVLKSPKGIYMQLESGKIIAIKTSLKGLQKGVDTKDNPVGKKVLGARPTTNIPGSLKNNSAITITSKTGPRPGLNRIITRPSLVQNKISRPLIPGQKLAEIRNRLGELRSYSPIRGRYPIPQGRLLRPNLPGSVSITRVPKEAKKLDSDNDSSTANKTGTGSEEDAQVLDTDEDAENSTSEGDKESKIGTSVKDFDIKDINHTNVTEKPANDKITPIRSDGAENKIPKNIPVESNYSQPENKIADKSKKNQLPPEVQQMILTTDEKIPTEEALENRCTEEITDLSMSSQIKMNVESPQQNPVEPIERKINLLKNYRHQRPGARPHTESSLSQLEKTASALNSEGGPDFRKNLDDITQSYSPGLEEKPITKSKKKKSPVKLPNMPESHAEMQPSVPNMSHSVSNLLGNSSSNVPRKVEPLPHMVPPMNAQPMMPNHSTNPVSQDSMSPMSSRGQPVGYGMPQNYSASSLPSMPPSMGHGSAISSSSTSPGIDVGKIPAVPSVPVIPTPTQAYPPANPLPPERPYGQYPGYGMGFGAYPSGWEYGGYGAAPPYYPAYGAPPYAGAAPPTPSPLPPLQHPHPAHHPHPHPAHPAHPSHPAQPPEGYIPPNPQW